MAHAVVLVDAEFVVGASGLTQIAVALFTYGDADGIHLRRKQYLSCRAKGSQIGGEVGPKEIEQDQSTQDQGASTAPAIQPDHQRETDAQQHGHRGDA